MMSRESAETLALQALGWLAANDDLMPVFLGASGASVSDIKSQAGDPEFLGSVLDFLLMDDAWVIAFGDATHLPYDHVMQARQLLPGGAQVHWT